MNLGEYLAGIRSVMAVQPAETAIYSDALLTEGLRQALREYELSAPPVIEEKGAPDSGHEQDLSATLAGLVELVFVAWPWPNHGEGLDVTERLVRWHWRGPGTIWIVDGEPKIEEPVLFGYRQRHTIAGLDSAPATTPAPEHERMLVVGAAGWTAELHYRQAAESVKGPSAEQMKRMYTWSHLRMQEFRAWLQDLGRAAPAVRPVWGSIGL